jgi:hypothetical protein
MLFAMHVSAPAQVNDPMSWRAEHVNYAQEQTTPSYAWIITPSDEGTSTGGTFDSTVEGIFREEPSPNIKHVYLNASHRKGPLQEEVIRQLKDTVVVKRYPTRHDAEGRMYLDGTANPLDRTMRQLVYAAILNTSVVKDMNRVLGRHGLRIDEVSTEKLYIASDNGRFRWDAITSLIVRRSDTSPR